MPLPVDPMLARALPDGADISCFGRDAWILEEKYDGHRLIIETKGEIESFAREILVYSRAGNLRVLPLHIRKALAWLPAGIFDGEGIIPGGTSTDVKAIDLQDRMRLVLFDIMRVGMADVTSMPLHERRALLDKATSLVDVENEGVIQLSRQMDPTEANLKAIWNAGGEGAIVKRLDSRYEEGKRSPSWVKFKKELAATVTIVGFEKGLLGPHSKIVAQDDHGTRFTIKTLNDAWRAMFAEHASTYVGRKLVINYQQGTAKGKYRHPRCDHIL